MRYYIDFEAAQPSFDILSVGCVDEHGREFYTLVQPESPDCITDFIVKLTGITADKLTSAPCADEAFRMLFDWMDKTQRAEFICYGNCDNRFVKRTLGYVEDFTAQCMLGLILGSLNDYTIIVNSHFGISRSVSLTALEEYYSGRSVTPTHNALDDARRLKYVYNMVSNNDPPAVCPFPEKLKEKEKKKKNAAPVRKRKYIYAVRDGKSVAFKNYGAASNWIISSHRHDLQDNNGEKSRVATKIACAVKRGKTYYGYQWVLGYAE